MKLRISEAVEDKLWKKKNRRISFYELEEVALDPKASISRTANKGKFRVYEVIGKTKDGRTLFMVVISKPSGVWVMTARDADSAQKRRYTGR